MQLNAIPALCFAGDPESKVVSFGGQVVVNVLTGVLWARPANANEGSNGYVAINTPGTENQDIQLNGGSIEFADADGLIILGDRAQITLGADASLNLDESVQISLSSSIGTSTGAAIATNTGGLITTSFNAATPEGVLTASPGAIVTCNNSGTGRLFVKKTGTGNTGWSEVTLP